MIDATTTDFIRTHIHNDPKRLLLSAQCYPGVDVRFAAQQIEARQRIKDKLPKWFAHPQIVFPSSLACQQASSEESARYKQRFLHDGECVIDCTGGLGVDSAAFSSKAGKVIYIEQNQSLCKVAEHNFQVLGITNVEVMQGDCINTLKSLSCVNLIYIDPSRRSAEKRLFALNDYEPDIVAIRHQLLQKAHKVLVKVSPMADITQCLRLLPETTQVHVVSIKNECKELLFLLERPHGSPIPLEDIPISCVHIDAAGKEELFCFTLGMEEATHAPMAGNTFKGWLYEPNASLLKAGAFKLPALHFGLQKVHLHTHLYFAPVLEESFPGRIFQIKEVIDFNKQTIKNLQKTISQANVAVRNFCMEAQELQKRLKIKDGGDVYLFGVTLGDQSYALIVATKEN
ncbi:MAG: RsmD family RNA methyltransferase [Bacteroidales bacterium]|nr:RsmD family RNA methyltransferase [Bacteroidales bacterium]